MLATPNFKPPRPRPFWQEPSLQTVEAEEDTKPDAMVVELEGEPDKLDRLASFPTLRESMPDTFQDILYKNKCDVAFAQVLDDAKLRNLVHFFREGRDAPKNIWLL